jgi:Domain of unknown function (DUF5753)
MRLADSATSRCWAVLFISEIIERKRRSVSEARGTAESPGSYQPIIVPGLLQTPEYARAMAEVLGVTPGRVNELVEVKRQRRPTVKYSKVFDRLHAMALSPQESVKLIAKDWHGIPTCFHCSGGGSSCGLGMYEFLIMYEYLTVRN